ncbi:MAG: Ig-like domain-containing protein [Prevotella sp.]|nr:Ig-like domain-containing protein [Prevotella sp.]MBR0048096.1 Ig-like domain-containing protein [Prevotella sp.]
MTFYFNQNIKYNGGVAINGKNYERITNVTTSGPALTITYEGFDINTDYTITFPAGCVTSMNGDKLLEEAATFNFSTCDFGSLDDIKDTHKGRTAPLPINLSMSLDCWNVKTIPLRRIAMSIPTGCRCRARRLPTKRYSPRPPTRS